MIEIKDEWYYVGFWYAELARAVSGPRGGNFLAALYQKDDTPADRWELTYRFRYFMDDKLHDSADRKSWWHAEVTCALEQAKAAADHLLAEGAKACGFERVEFLPVYGMGAKALQVMQTVPYFSSKRMKA